MRRPRPKDRLKYKPIRRPCNSCGSRKRCLDPSIPISEKKRNKTSCILHHQYLSSLQVGQYLHGENWIPEHGIGTAESEGVQPEKPPDRFLWSDHYNDKSKKSASAIAKWNMIKLSITPKQRVVLFQQIVKKKSIDDIASTLNLSWQSVYDRIKQANIRIKRYGKHWTVAPKKHKPKTEKQEEIISEKLLPRKKELFELPGKVWRMCKDTKDCKKCFSGEGIPAERCPVDGSILKWQTRNLFRLGPGDKKIKVQGLQIPCK